MNYVYARLGCNTSIDLIVIIILNI